MALIFHRQTIAIFNNRTASGGLASQSDDFKGSWKNSTIAVRSNRDRGAIEPRSWSCRRGIASTGSDGGQLRSRITIDAQSWPDRRTIVARSQHDRGLIAARSWPDRGSIVAYFEATLRLIHLQIGEDSARI